MTPSINASASLADDGSSPERTSALPKGPVFDWCNLRTNSDPAATAHLRSIGAVPNRLFTTSGRAALFQALMQLRLEPGSGVLVPTYHCPSMVAPIIRASLKPVFYGMRSDGTPNLDGIGQDHTDLPRALFVAHYFGLPHDLGAIRAWCDSRGIALIEDCAHCFFGQAGERAVGHWGDYAIASLTKFFPAPEGGLLVSTRGTLAPADLAAPGWVAEIKGWVDLLEVSCRHGRLRGTRSVLRAVFAAKNRLRGRAHGKTTAAANGPSAGDAVTDCDMGRVGQAPLHVSRLMFTSVDQGRIYARRRENYLAYAAASKGLGGARALMPTLPDGAAPYVFPLWVDDAQRVYDALRLSGMPVFRWDRVWPGTPTLPADHAPQWRHHVLQLLCHQDLSPADVSTTCAALSRLVASAGAAATLRDAHAVQA